MKNPLAYLCDIVNECQFIMGTLRNISADTFASDKVLTRAIERSLEIIGEASGKIPESLKNKYKNIPWKYMKGLRNIIAHEYSRVDYDIIWNIATTNIPNLYADISEILKAEGWECDI